MTLMIKDFMVISVVNYCGLPANQSMEVSLLACKSCCIFFPSVLCFLRYLFTLNCCEPCKISLVIEELKMTFEKEQDRKQLYGLGVKNNVFLCFYCVNLIVFFPCS